MTAARACPLTSSRSVCSWCSMWMSEVEMKVWMRGRAASFTAPQAASMSALWVRARPQTTGPSTLRAIAWTASKSPGEVIGKPASITSTPRRASCWAISTFSPVFSEMPGDCSPSRRVVSKMWTRLASVAVSSAGPIGPLLLSESNGLCLSRLSRRPALFPPKGEEKEKREAVRGERPFELRSVA